MSEPHGDDRDIFGKTREVIVAGSKYCIHYDGAFDGEPLGSSRTWATTEPGPDESPMPFEMILLVDPKGVQHRLEWLREWRQWDADRLAQCIVDSLEQERGSQ